MENPVHSLKETFTHNLGTKLISFVVAIILWVVVLGSRHVEVTKEVPLEILTPTDLIVSNEMPDKISFRLSGPKAFLRTLADRREEPVRVSLLENKPGLVNYRFFSDHIRLPIGVKVLSVSPPSLVIKLEELRRREVPVRVVTEGRLPFGFSVKSLKSFPSTVMIKGPASRIEGISEILSAPVKLDDLGSSLERELKLDLARSGVQLEGSLPKLRVDIENYGANYKIKNIPVRVVSSLRVKVDPPSITALIYADPAELKKLNRNKIFATINMENRERGTYQESPIVVLPPGVTAVRTSPETVTLTLY